MTDKQKEMLDALKLELRFVEHGGYARSVREPRKELAVFQDSSSCLNYGSSVREHPCSECFLMGFVPGEKRGENVPCHHIPLNDSGDTLASLEGYGRDADVNDAVRQWLKRTIADLEKVQ